MADFRLIRAESDDELAVWLDVRNRVVPDDAIALADVKSMVDTLEHEAHVVAFAGDEPVGAAVALIEDRPAPYTAALVLPEHRRRGVGSALYRWLSAWARERGSDELEVWVKESEPAGLEFATNRGFAEVGREKTVVLDLAASEPVVIDPPEGIEIVTWAERPELARGLYEVALEASPDIPGEEDVEVASFEDWLARDMGGAGDLPEATFVALAGDEVVGFAKFSLTSAQPTNAYHDLTGVKRAWRGKGIAAALKSVQVQWARDNGYERVYTNNEERNTPIRRLNERFGYKPEPGRILMRGPAA